MIRENSTVVWVASCIIALAFAARLQAGDDQPIKLALHPMASPTPALKYRLLPPATDLTSGNAAVPYGKVTAEEQTYFDFRDRARWDKIEDVWPGMPLDKLRSEKITLPTSSIFFLEQGAKCKTCDWQLPIGQMPFYAILLPDVQQSRSYARLLSIKARMEIANGKFDDAIKTFQTNYALARNISRSETLVSGLVGIAISGLMFPQVAEYVQQPQSPNLYWAVTNLPRPFINMGDALDIESQAMELSFSELRDVENTRRTPDEWRDLFYRFAKKILEWNQDSDNPSPLLSQEELDNRCKQFAPAAKHALIASGFPPEKVEAMTDHQIALIYSLRTYHMMFDDTAKSYSLPYPEAIEGIDAAIERSQSPSEQTPEIVPIAAHTLRAIQSTRAAVARNERQFAVLRVFEALRIYAAAHDAKPPVQLADITEVPIPDDPVTGKAFRYRRDGAKAFLEGPALRDVPFRYEISMTASK